MADIKRFGTNFDKLTWPPRATYSPARQPDRTEPRYRPGKKVPVDLTPFVRRGVALANGLFSLFSPCPYLYRLYLPRLLLGFYPVYRPPPANRFITQRRAVIVNLDFSRVQPSTEREPLPSFFCASNEKRRRPNTIHEIVVVGIRGHLRKKLRGAR